MEHIIEQSITADGSFLLFFLLLASIPTILCIVLFFKIWIMTNDVSKIKDMLKEQLDLEHPYVEVNTEASSTENKIS